MIAIIIILFIFNTYTTVVSQYDNENDYEYCAFVKCPNNQRCVVKKFWCKRPPCPRMLYCAKTYNELSEGPTTCNNVKCSNGYVCTLTLRHCSWDKPCKEQTARCITDEDYIEGPESCAEYSCPSGKECILRESFCSIPPCKLFRSCISRYDVHNWLDKCKSLGCVSQHECFLRKPNKICEPIRCPHIPDCIAKSETELIATKKCRGWVCPKGQTCVTQTKRPCRNSECKINRSCQGKIIKTSISNESYEYINDTDKILRRHGINLTYGINDNSPIINAILTASVRNQSANNEFTSNTTSNSVNLWLDYIKNNMGLNAVNTWVKKSEEEKYYPEFRQWLILVKDLIGNAAFDYWLQEIRNVTMSNKNFQQWLPSSAHTIDEFKIFTKWNSTMNDNPNHKIYETDSLMNPKFKLLSLFNNNTKTPDQNSSNLFKLYVQPINVTNRVDIDTFDSLEQYILSVLKLILKLLEGITPVIEFNKDSLLKQLQNETATLDKDSRMLLLRILEKVKEERKIYAYVINKTQDLISKAQPLVPSHYIDSVIQKIHKNNENNHMMDGRKTMSTATNKETNNNIRGNHNYDNNDNIKNNGSITNLMTKSQNYYNDYPTEYLTVDYGDPITHLEFNETIPRFVIMLEDMFQPSNNSDDIKSENRRDLDNKSIINRTTPRSVKTTRDDYYNYDDADPWYILRTYEKELNGSIRISDRSKDKHK